MKEHIIRELVNQLCRTAKIAHDKDCLRDMVLKDVLEALNADVEWYKGYAAAAEQRQMPDMRLHQEVDKSFMTKLPKT